MLGIGHRLEKETKKKVLLQKAKQFNQKYDQLAAQGKETEAVQIIKKEQYQRRHQVPPNLQPYKNSKKMNELCGTVHLGYDLTEKTLTQTQTLYKPMEEHMTKTKAGLKKFDQTKAKQQIDDFNRMKVRIHKDHLADDVEIQFGDPKQTDYSRNYKNDHKLQQEVRDRNKQYNQKMNDLKDYAQHYLKSKSVLRKC